MNLGEKIYELRIHKNLSQGDLADALDVSRQSVSKWENNQAVPDLDKLVKMCDLFEITLDELVRGTTHATQAPSSQPKNTIDLLSSFPMRKIIGVLLLACGFLLLLISTISGNQGSGLILAIPFGLCGLTCFLFRKHLGIWCAWALFLPISFIPIHQYMRSDIALLIRLFIQLPLLICTVMAWRNEPLTGSRVINWFLGVGYMLWFLWFSMWLATLSWQTTELCTGFDLMHLLQTLSYPLFTALLTTTVRLLHSK